MNVQSPIRNVDASAPRVKPPQKKRGRGWKMFAAILTVLLAAGGYWYYTVAANRAPEPIIATATRGEVEDVVTAVGNLTPILTVDVGAQVTGQLQSLQVKIGDDVMKGQLLAEIDSSVMAAKVDADRAQLQNFQAQLAENAIEIRTIASQLYERLQTVWQHYADTGRQLEKTVECYNRSVGSWDTRLMPAVRRMQELGVKPDAEECVLEPIDVLPRVPRLPDFTYSADAGSSLYK